MGRDEQFIRRIRRLALTAQYPPIAGGAPEGDDDGTGGADGGDGDGSGDVAGDVAGDGSGGDGPGDDGSDAERLGRLEAENQRLKREAAARERDRRKAEADRKKAEDERKAQAGEWEKLANERAERISELEQQISERDRKDAEREQRTTAEKVADKLNFRRPRRAYALLADELSPEDLAETLANEQLTEAALKRLAREEPELVDQQRRSGAPVNGARGTGGLTPQQRANRTIAGLLRGGSVQE
jgi:hypothetical protein